MLKFGKLFDDGVRLPLNIGDRSIEVIFSQEAMSQKYAVIFEQTDGNWAAYVPDLPGCITTGETLEETERKIREAIQGLLPTLREFGDPVILAHSTAWKAENEVDLSDSVAPYSNTGKTAAYL